MTTPVLRILSLLLAAAAACSSPPPPAGPGEEERRRDLAAGDLAGDLAAGRDLAAGDLGPGRDLAAGPVRLPCTSTFGTALVPGYGRLDGDLVSIVMPGTTGCLGDQDHLHLQVRMGGAVYDVAVSVGKGPAAGDVFFATQDLPPPGPPFREGWRRGVSLDYAALGAGAGTFVTRPRAELAREIEAALARTGPVSVFATAYGAQGAHLVHRRNGGDDGAIVIDPQSARARLLLFRFADQSF